MRGKRDDDQLRFAWAGERTPVTHNRVDFEKLHAEYLDERLEHHGIIVVKRRRNSEEIIRRLLHLLDSVTPEDMIQQLRYI